MTARYEDLKIENWRDSYQWLMALFYFFQGFYYFGTNIYVMTMMANWDLPVGQQTTVTAILGLPLYIKVVPALVSDRIYLQRWGRRKPFIILGALLYLPGFGLLLALRHFSPFWISAVLLTLVAWMLVDGALDGLAVDITPAGRTTQIQSASWGGRLLGMSLAGLLIPLLGPRSGWTIALVCLGTGALLQSMVPLFIDETSPAGELLQRGKLPLREALQSAFRGRLMWLSILFLLFFSTSIYTGTLLSIYALSELGWSSSPEMMSVYGRGAILASLSAAAGAFILGRLPGKSVTSFKFYAVYQVLFWIMSLSWLVVHHDPGNVLKFYSVTGIWSAFYGLGTGLSLALIMRICPKSIEGFSFALMVSVTNLGNSFLGPKTVATLSQASGGILPALFSLIPYGLISLLFLRGLLNALAKRGDEVAPIAA